MLLNKFEKSSFILFFDIRVVFFLLLSFFGRLAAIIVSSIDFSEFNVFILAFVVALFASAYKTLIKNYL